MKLLAAVYATLLSLAPCFAVAQAAGGGSDSGTDPHRYEKSIEAWLSPFKPNYPANSPWWGFYSYSIATAREADTGQLSQAAAGALIEERRLKFNQELAAPAPAKLATLNCSTEDPVHFEFALTLDYNRALVNGFSAQFYDNQIRWTQKGSNGGPDYHSMLNRLSGLIIMGADGVPGLLTGRCTQATKQF